MRIHTNVGTGQPCIVLESREMNLVDNGMRAILDSKSDDFSSSHFCPILTQERRLRSCTCTYHDGVLLKFWMSSKQSRSYFRGINLPTCTSVDSFVHRLPVTTVLLCLDWLKHKARSLWACNTFLSINCSERFSGHCRWLHLYEKTTSC